MVDLIPLLIGAAAIVHCFFLIAVLLRLSRKLGNSLLAAALFFLAIRMGGCIAGLIDPNFELTGLYLGAISFAMTGPLIYFYLHCLWNPSFRLQPQHTWHFILAGLELIAAPFFNIYIVFGLYQLSLLSFIVYVVHSYSKFNRKGSANRADNMRWNWMMNFISGIGILLILFVCQSFFFDAVVYKGIIISSALILYILTLVAVKKVKLFMYEPKRKNIQQQVEELGKRIEEVLSQEQVFTDPLMNVSMLAKHLGEPPYMVSMAVNAYSGKSFPEMLNALRIQKAEVLLTDPTKSHFTIEAIAYDSGFSTLSAFYSSFKKVNRKTPMKYRNQLLKNDAKIL